jgi:hypothetical protein
LGTHGRSDESRLNSDFWYVSLGVFTYNFS